MKPTGLNPYLFVKSAEGAIEWTRDHLRGSRVCEARACALVWRGMRLVVLPLIDGLRAIVALAPGREALGAMGGCPPNRISFSPMRRVLLLRLAAAVVLAGGCAFVSAPAKAQSECTTPELTGRTTIWSATVTVAQFLSAFDTADGYRANPSAGSLSSTGVTVEGTSYTIDEIYVTESVGSLSFSLNKNLSSTDRSEFRLHVCDEEYNFSAAALVTSTNTYSWGGNLDWSEEETRTLRLSIPQRACGAPELGGRAVVWTATLTTARFLATGDEADGYREDPSAGSISSTGFEVAGTSYTVDGIFVRQHLGLLSLSLDKNLASTDRSELRLHVCNDEYELSAATHGSSTSTYAWSTSLDWGRVIRRSLWLSIPNATAATGAPEIIGRARVGVTLRASIGTVADTDGLPQQEDFDWQWIRLDADGSSNPVAIDGAAAETYELSAGDVGAKIRLELRFEDVEGNSERRQSVAWPAEGTVVSSGACPESELGGRSEVGSTTVTLVAIEALPGVPGYGYFAGLAGRDARGTVSTQELVIDEQTYRIQALHLVHRVDEETEHDYVYYGYAPTDLIVSLDSRLEAAHEDDVRVHACNSVFDFASSDQKYRYSETEYDYVWGNTGLDWSGHEQIEVVFSRPAMLRAAVAPSVIETPVLSAPGAQGRWTPGETVEVTLAFSEAVHVDTSQGRPSIGLTLGGVQTRSAPYARGSGTSKLVFAYTLTYEDGSHTAMLVPIDSLALNGGTIRSVATGADATLSHSGGAEHGTGGRGRRGTPFSATLHGVPETHDGSTPFSIELRFIAPPDALGKGADAADVLEVTGATVESTGTTGDGGRSWRFTLTPSGTSDITVAVPVRICTATASLCARGQPLAGAVNASVPWVRPLTGTLTGPRVHDGETKFEVVLKLSEQPGGMSWRTVKDRLFTVTGANIERVRRTGGVRNKQWTLTVMPAGNADITLTLKDSVACGETHAVCTTDGRALRGGARISIQGPVTISVADANVQEGPNAQLGFAVTLSRSRTEETSVEYATSDGSATEGEDYEEASGTLTFNAGETSKTIEVTVLDDAHDEGEETMTLTLSSPSGARLGRATATGTIENDDPMPQAWVVRFGRTVGSQVVDALTARLDTGGGSRVTVGGVSLNGGVARQEEPKEGRTFKLPEWDERARLDAKTRTMTADEVLRRSAFHVSAGGEHPGTAEFSAWVHFVAGGFEAEKEGVTMDGDVTTVAPGCGREVGPVPRRRHAVAVKRRGLLPARPEHGRRRGQGRELNDRDVPVP